MCLEHQTHLDMFGAIALMSAIRITGLHTVNILTHRKGTGDHRQSENNYQEDILYIVYRLVTLSVYSVSALLIYTVDAKIYRYHHSQSSLHLSPFSPYLDTHQQQWQNFDISQTVRFVFLHSLIKKTKLRYFFTVFLLCQCQGALFYFRKQKSWIITFRFASPNFFLPLLFRSVFNLGGDLVLKFCFALYNFFLLC